MLPVDLLMRSLVKLSIGNIKFGITTKVMLYYNINYTVDIHLHSRITSSDNINSYLLKTYRF